MSRNLFSEGASDESKVANAGKYDASFSAIHKIPKTASSDRPSASRESKPAPKKAAPRPAAKAAQRPAAKPTPKPKPAAKPAPRKADPKTAPRKVEKKEERRPEPKAKPKKEPKIEDFKLERAEPSKKTQDFQRSLEPRTQPQQMLDMNDPAIQLIQQAISRGQGPISQRIMQLQERLQMLRQRAKQFGLLR